MVHHRLDHSDPPVQLRAELPVELRGDAPSAAVGELTPFIHGGEVPPRGDLIRVEFQSDSQRLQDTAADLILKELREIMEKEKKPPFDIIRRKYLKELSDYTGRNTILYATKWTQPANIPFEMISITDEDIQGFMEVIS